MLILLVDFKLILILDSICEEVISFEFFIFLLMSKLSFFQISTPSSAETDIMNKKKISGKKSFFYKFNNFIGDIFFNFLFWGWKIKFT